MQGESNGIEIGLPKVRIDGETTPFAAQNIIDTLDSPVKLTIDRKGRSKRRRDRTKAYTEEFGLIPGKNEFDKTFDRDEVPPAVGDEDRLYIFGIDDDLVLSFTLDVGHYQLLFQNRYFTKEEIETNPDNDCQDLEYDDCDYIDELCLLTFIPTDKVIEPAILVDRGSLNSEKSSTPLVLFDREINQNKDD